MKAKNIGRNALLSIILFSGNQFELKAQASLPAFWDMGNITSPPVGWNYDLLKGSGTNLTYTTSAYYSSAPQSMRFDNSDEFLDLHFVGKPDTMTFSIRHTGTSDPYSGTFEVIQSPDGITWTTLISYKNSMPRSMTKITTRLKGTTRFVRFIFKQKNSGYNVALDDVSILPAIDGLNPEIAVYKDNGLINNGELVQVGNCNGFPIIIRNKSKFNPLILDSFIWKGYRDSMFLSIAPKSISPLSEDTFWIGNSDSISGTYRSTLLIYSNDSNGNSPFTIPVYLIHGNSAEEPEASDISGIFTEVKPWKIQINSFTNNTEKILVLCNNNGELPLPKDGISYEKGAYLGNSRIIYNGPGNTFTADKIECNSRYYFSIFGYNGFDTFVNYNTTNYIETDTLTPGLNEGNYYDAVDIGQTSFIADLKRTIRPHKPIYYSNYGSAFGNVFEAYDTTFGRKVLSCYYSGYKYLYVPPLIWDTMSREHSYPHSWMGEQSEDSANYNDLFLLFPVHQNKANLIRSNYPLNNLKSVSFQFLLGKFGLDSNGNPAYEPQDKVKGEISRACFYTCAAYNQPSKPFTIPSSVSGMMQKQNESVLKKWNRMYPPDNKEMARQEFIYSLQGNRNPFIDHPEWACYIRFSDMSYLPGGNCELNSTLEQVQVFTPVLFPNPAGSCICLDPGTLENGTIDIYDITERKLMHLEFNKGIQNIPLQGLQAGTYLVLINSGNRLGIAKFTHY
ncbi:MAG: endonuclease [Bacteroidetes bacterium]|nr:endonuclease [Bacteroidota bacterium]